MRDSGVISTTQAPGGQSYSMALKQKIILTFPSFSFTKGLDKNETYDFLRHESTYMDFPEKEVTSWN